MVYNSLMSKPELDQQLNMKIDGDTLVMLRVLSVDEQRSMSAQIRYLIRKAFDQRLTTDKPAAKYAAE